MASDALQTGDARLPTTAFHPVDPDQARDPFDALMSLRQTCPISQPRFRDYPPTILFTRYDDIAEILRGWHSFGSIGIALNAREAEEVPLDKRIHIELNPPQHTDVRRLLLSAVAPPIITRVSPRLEALGHEVVSRFSGRGHADLVAEWAAQYPAIAIASVLGLPEHDAEMIHQWVDSRFTESALSESEASGSAPRTGTELDDWFMGYLHDQLEARRRGAADLDDGIRRMMSFAAPSGRTFTDDELCVHIHSLLVAGNETTTSLMSNLMYRVLMTPGLFARLRNDRTLIPPLIEESARLDAPLQVLTRACRNDTEIAKTPIHDAEVVVLSIASGNRDEAVWGDDADQFRPDRFAEPPAKDHLGFGLGIHYCPGAHLARLSTRIALEALLDATADMHIADGYGYDKVYFYILRRPKQLPVEFEPAS